MSEFLDKEPSNLSGGQKQRVAIAGTLATHPKLLIMDESTAMLDPKGKREIRELTMALRKEDPS
jgi:energy-coupling factor transport system ATP-binding protein